MKRRVFLPGIVAAFLPLANSFADTKVSLDQTHDVIFEQFSNTAFSLNLLQAKNKFALQSLNFGGMAEGDLQYWHGDKILTTVPNTYQSGFSPYLTEAVIDVMININTWSTAFFSAAGSNIWQGGPDGNYTYIPRAFIVVGNLDKFPVYFTMGMNSIPFGVFTGTGTWDQPLTYAYFYPQQAPQLSLAFYKNNWNASATGYNDMVYHVNHFVCNLAYNNTFKSFKYGFGAGYLTNLSLNTTGSPRVSASSRKNGMTQNKSDAGQILDLNASLAYKLVTLTGEYVWGSNQIALNDNTPSTLSATLSYVPVIYGEDTTFGISYSKSLHVNNVPTTLAGQDQVLQVASGLKNTLAASASRSIFKKFLALGLAAERNVTYTNQQTYTYTLDLTAYL